VIDAIAAEWIKLRSVRSTYGLLAVVGLAVAGVTLLTWWAVAFYDTLDTAQREHFGLADPGQLAAWAAELAMAVLGVLAIAPEYRSGMVATTYAAVPRRGRVLLAKAAVVGPVALVAGEAAALGGLLAGRGIIGDRPIRGSSAPIGDEVRFMLASGLAVAGFALLSLGLGALLRSAVGALATVFGLWYILPIVSLHLPTPWVGELMLPNLAQSVAGQGAVPPWVAVLVLVAYAGVPLAAAAKKG
jgi:ABC-2 type transport system permease protein